MKYYIKTVERTLCVLVLLTLAASCRTKNEHDDISKQFVPPPSQEASHAVEKCYVELSKRPFSFNAVPDSLTAHLVGKVYMSRYFGLIDSTNRMTVRRTTRETWMITCQPQEVERGQFEIELDCFSGEVLYFNDLEDV